MRAADRIEGDIHAPATRSARSELTHRGNEVTWVSMATAPKRSTTGRFAAEQVPIAVRPRWLARSSSAVPTVPEAPTTRIVAPNGRLRQRVSI